MQRHPTFEDEHARDARQSEARDRQHQARGEWLEAAVFFLASAVLIALAAYIFCTAHDAADLAVSVGVFSLGLCAAVVAVDARVRRAKGSRRRLP